MRPRRYLIRRLLVLWTALALALPPALLHRSAEASALPAALSLICSTTGETGAAHVPGAADPHAGSCHACPAACHGGALPVPLAAVASVARWSIALAWPDVAVVATPGSLRTVAPRGPPAA